MAMLKDESGDEGTDFEESKESAQAAFDPMSEPVVLAAVASVAFSWYQFYIRENEVHGIFVGLWAPTLLGAASYLKELQIAKKINAGLSFG